MAVTGDTANVSFKKYKIIETYITFKIYIYHFSYLENKIGR